MSTCRVVAGFVCMCVCVWFGLYTYWFNEQTCRGERKEDGRRLRSLGREPWPLGGKNGTQSEDRRCACLFPFVFLWVPRSPARRLPTQYPPISVVRLRWSNAHALQSFVFPNASTCFFMFFWSCWLLFPSLWWLAWGVLPCARDGFVGGRRSAEKTAAALDTFFGRPLPPPPTTHHHPRPRLLTPIHLPARHAQGWVARAGSDVQLRGHSRLLLLLPSSSSSSPVHPWR